MFSLDVEYENGFLSVSGYGMVCNEIEKETICAYITNEIDKATKGKFVDARKELEEIINKYISEAAEKALSEFRSNHEENTRQ